MNIAIIMTILYYKPSPIPSTVRSTGTVLVYIRYNIIDREARAVSRCRPVFLAVSRLVPQFLALNSRIERCGNVPRRKRLS